MLWVLDSYFLALERKYRDLYNTTRKKDNDDIDYSMKIAKMELSDIWKAFISISMILFYLSLEITSFIFYTLIK